MKQQLLYHVNRFAHLAQNVAVLFEPKLSTFDVYAVQALDHVSVLCILNISKLTIVKSAYQKSLSCFMM